MVEAKLCVCGRGYSGAELGQFACLVGANFEAERGRIDEHETVASIGGVYA